MKKRVGDQIKATAEADGEADGEAGGEVGGGGGGGGGGTVGSDCTIIGEIGINHNGEVW